ncbi:MAG: hypothetical protein MK234_04735, partial [Nitrospinales bacterium]|nr:hypothetical protein [Nitrospinales bacterium]
CSSIKSPKNGINLFICLLDALHCAAHVFTSIHVIFIHVLLLCIIVCDLFCLLLRKCLIVVLTRASNQQLSSKQLSISLLMLLTLNPSLISIILRSLLLRSGIESNPGPSPPKLLSFGVWNVDSLLAREGVKKSYIESLQSVYKFDLLGLCETYLTDKIPNMNLKLRAFRVFPYVQIVNYPLLNLGLALVFAYISKSLSLSKDVVILS